MLTTSSDLNAVIDCKMPSESRPDAGCGGYSLTEEYAEEYFIPDTLATWPWPRRLNQHYLEVSAESSAWAVSFEAFSPKAQATFDRCQFSKS
jgi:hypothetical protein